MMTQLPHPTQHLQRLPTLCLAAVAAALLVTACGGGDDDGDGSYAAVDGTSTPNTANGQTLYNTYCKSCHGSSYAKARNAPSTLSAISTNRGGMGSLSTTIRAQQATDIAAYLQYGVTTATTAATTSTTVASGTTTTTVKTTTTTTATTSATAGKTAYANNSVMSCGSTGCHGTPPSSNKILSGANNPSIINNAIASGSGGMGMYAGGKLTPQQITDIATYLATPGIW